MVNFEKQWPFSEFDIESESVIEFEKILAFGIYDEHNNNLNFAEVEVNEFKIIKALQPASQDQK